MAKPVMARCDKTTKSKLSSPGWSRWHGGRGRTALSLKPTWSLYWVPRHQEDTESVSERFFFLTLDKTASRIYDRGPQHKQATWGGRPAPTCLCSCLPALFLTENNGPTTVLHILLMGRRKSQAPFLDGSDLIGRSSHKWNGTVPWCHCQLKLLH